MQNNDDPLWVLPGPDPGPTGTAAPPRATVTSPDPPAATVAPGDRIAGRFEVQHALGRGGMGTVYQASDTLRDEPVAIKVLVPGLLSDPDALRHFKSEATIATTLSHPNIVTVYDFHEVDGTYAIVMERLHGKTLRDLIRDRNAAANPFSPDEVDDFLQPLAAALDYAHRFTVHRDIKPENVWVAEDGSLKLMDFGLAELVQRGDAAPLSLHTLSQLRLGSPYYTAPEQLHGAHRTTAAADQFALGVIAYELLSGELPVGLAKPLRQRRPDLPYALTGSVDRALAKIPTDRFQSVHDFAAAFHHGCRSRRSLRQLLDTRPLLRKSLLASTAVAAAATLTAVLVDSFESRANQIVERTRGAQSEITTRRAGIFTLRDLANQVERRRTEAEATLNLALTNPPPSPDDIPAQLRNRTRIARITQDFESADLAWSLLAPRLEANGVPITLTNTLDQLEDHLDAHDFASFNRTLDQLDTALDHERQAITTAPQLAHARVTRRNLEIIDPENPTPSVATAPRPDRTLPERDDWQAALESSRAAIKELAAPLEERFASARTDHQQALAAWDTLFPENLGPPPVEFLGHPAAKAEAASRFHTLAQLDHAIPLMEEAAATVRSWADDVTSLRERCEPAWQKAVADGRSHVNPIGMRFVRIGDSYWSVWETRIMDFARYVAADGENSEAAGSRWMEPGFPVGPTHPVVFVEPDIGTYFGLWIRDNFPGTPTDSTESHLPDAAVWRKLLSRQPEWPSTPLKWALYPDENEMKKPNWLDEWQDPAIDAADHIKPVASSSASTDGLYDLFGNAWEWARDLQTFPQGTTFIDRPFNVLFAGGMFGHVGFDGRRAGDDQTALVGRPDAIGFRLVIPAAPLDERLGGSRQD